MLVLFTEQLIKAKHLFEPHYFLVLLLSWTLKKVILIYQKILSD